MFRLPITLYPFLALSLSLLFDTVNQTNTFVQGELIHNSARLYFAFNARKQWKGLSKVSFCKTNIQGKIIFRGMPTLYALNRNVVSSDPNIRTGIFVTLELV
jgi:hypothetical protein